MFPTPLGLAHDGWYPPPDILPSDIDIENMKVPPVYKDKQNVWLFDVKEDPLEKHELSHVYPDVVKNLLDKLTAYNKTAVHCRYPPPDPRSNPDRHGGAWGPWE